MKFLKLIMFIILSACSVATYAKNKEKLVIVHVTDLPKQYSFSPNTSIEVQSVSDKPLNVKKWLLIEVLVLHYLMTELKIYLVMVVEQNI